jgi:hypothetical protein
LFEGVYKVILESKIYPNFDPRNPILIPWQKAAPQLMQADILQWRTGMLQWSSWFIAGGTMGYHSHSAMVRKNGDDRIDALEMIEVTGGRAVPLESQVQQYPGIIDVFRIDRNRWWEFDADGAVNYMRQLTSRKYGRLGLWRVAAMRMFGVRLYWMIRGFPIHDDARSEYDPFCSHSISSACRIGGNVDLVPRKPDFIVTPNDLTCSACLSYVFTLVI